MSQKVSQLKFQIEMQDSVFSSDFNFVIADSRILYSVFFGRGDIFSIPEGSKIKVSYNDNKPITETYWKININLACSMNGTLNL